MTNPYYTASGNPVPGAAGLSAIARAEFAAITTAFGKMPPMLIGNAGKLIVVNSAEDGLIASPISFPGPAGPYLPVTGGAVVGAVTLSGVGTGLTVSNAAIIGGDLAVAGATGLSVSNNASVSGTLTSSLFQTSDHTYTLSGSTLAPPLNIFANYKGTSTNANPAMALFTISRAAVNSLGTINGFFNTAFQMNVGDGNGLTGTAGSQGGVLIGVNQDGPIASGGSSIFLGALNAWFVGGAAITGGFGNGIAFNPQILIGAGASGYGLLETIEGTVQSDQTGTTLATRGFSAAFSGGSNQGQLNDFAYLAARNPGKVGFKQIISLGRTDAPWGLDSAGSIIGSFVQTNGGPGNGAIPQVAAYCVNLPTVNFGTAAWWTPGTQILGDGTHRIGTGSIAPMTAGLSIDVNDYSGATPTISVAGASYVVNDQLYDTNGGILQVDTVNGSGNITAFHYLRTPYSYGGAGAATMALRGGSGDQSAVVGVTWTHRTELDLGAASATVIRLGNSGSDTIVSGFFDITSVRTGSNFVVLDSGSAPAFQVVTVGNAVSYVAVTSVTSGNPKVESAGTAANLIIGTGAALATNATTGHILIPTCAGAPTGAAGAAGQAGIVWDTTNSKLWLTTGGGTWKGVVLS